MARLCRLPGITQRDLHPHHPTLPSHSACRHPARQLRFIWRWWQHTQVCTQAARRHRLLAWQHVVGKLVWSEEQETQPLMAFSKCSLVPQSHWCSKRDARWRRQMFPAGTHFCVTSRACAAAIIPQRKQAIACLCVSCCCMHALLQTDALHVPRL